MLDALRGGVSTGEIVAGVALDWEDGRGIAFAYAFALLGRCGRIFRPLFFLVFLPS
jgi:hypothetical protein